MNSTKLIAIILGAVASVAIFANLPASPTDAKSPVQLAWIEWKETHGRTYGTTTEETYRYGIFEKIYQEVNQVNALDLGFTYGLNKFSDLTSEEFSKQFLTLSSNNMYPGSASASFAIVDPNTDVDHRADGLVTPVKDQGQCGSCWAFSTTGSLEGAYKLANKDKDLPSFAEQQLVECAGSFGNNGCSGGLMDNAFQYVKQTGLTTEDHYEYTAQDGDCKPSRIIGGTKISGYTDVDANSRPALETALVGQPISIAVDAAGSAWQSYKSGIMKAKKGIFGQGCSSSQLDHGVLLVGMKTDSEGSYWIVKNSWGSGWGEEGYIRLERDTTKATGPGTCGLQKQPSFPTY